MNFAMLLAIIGVIGTTSMQSSTEFASVDGWTVQQRADGCFILGVYESPDEREQSFSVFMDTQEQMTLLFYDSGWSMESGDREDLGIVITRSDEPASWGDLSGSVVDDDLVGQTVVMSFDAEATVNLREDLYDGQGITLFTGDESIISLDIEENTAGFDKLGECLAAVG